MDAHGIPPTYPFHIAKAYAPQARPAAKTPSIDVVELAKPRSQAIGGLVAGKVSTAPNFAAPPAPKNSDTLPLYRHPADKNAAATGVSLGRSVDVNG